MKTMTQLLTMAAVSLLASGQTLMAQLDIPSDGSDGALIVSSNTVIDLGQAVTGTWSDNNFTHAGKGIYDPNKWAVVFKYSSVVISNGATLYFKNNATHAPVVWLVKEDVTINGAVSLDGQNNTSNGRDLPEPGPGGFRGGGEKISNYGYGSGYGPGGYYNDAGSYFDHHPYGNPQIVPLIGGSGGGSANPYTYGSYNGGAGGGAILIAAGSIITVNGTIHANGGAGNWFSAGLSWRSYNGSGGAIRLVADQILGSGGIYAYSGSYLGRIRLEANSASATLSVDPQVVSVSPYPLTIWPSTNAPSVRVVSVGNLPAPTDPHAEMSSGGDDIIFAETNNVTVFLETRNFPTNGAVWVYFKPRNAAQGIVAASYVSGDTNRATWKVADCFFSPNNHWVIQARAVSN